MRRLDTRARTVVPAYDTIKFNIDSQIWGPGPYTIAMAGTSVQITDSVIIDGTTQPGYLPNTNAAPGPINAVPQIVVTGAGNRSDGFWIEAPFVTLRGLVINGFLNPPIRIYQGVGHVVAGCFIGTNATGTAAYAYPDQATPPSSLIEFVGGDTSAVTAIIGGSSPADRNLIAGVYTSEAIVIDGQADVRIEGNLVGTDKTGLATLVPPTVNGIVLRQSWFDNTIPRATIVKNVVAGHNGALNFGIGTNCQPQFPCKGRVGSGSGP